MAPRIGRAGSKQRPGGNPKRAMQLGSMSTLPDWTIPWLLPDAAWSIYFHPPGSYCMDAEVYAGTVDSRLHFLTSVGIRTIVQCAVLEELLNTVKSIKEHKH